MTRRLEYANRQESYDTIRFFFDCGVFEDTGYGVRELPKTIEREHLRLLREKRRKDNVGAKVEAENFGGDGRGQP